MFRDYEAERINKLAEPFGLTFDALAEAIPLFHYGPGGCDGVDQFETFEQVLALVARVVQAERIKCGLSPSEQTEGTSDEQGRSS